MQNKLRIGLNLESCLILVYFLSIIVVNLSDSMATKAFYYISFSSCLLPFFYLRKKIPFFLILFSLGMGALCLLNLTLVGNLSYVKFFVIIGSFWIAFIFFNNRIKPNYLLTALYLCTAIVFSHFIIFGVETRVFVDCSNNYISVLLLAPTVVYYVLLDKLETNYHNIPVLPAFVVWVMAILGGGRGGFISCSILFWGIVFIKYFGRIQNKIQRTLLLLFVFMTFLPVLFSIIPYITQHYSGFRIVSHFSQQGVESGARFLIWSEYSLKTVRSRKNLLLGTKLSTIISAKPYDGNLHNSFLFVHSYLGIVGFLIMLIWLSKNMMFSIKHKKWLYFLCLLSFSLRGATDHVFGAGRYTPVFVFLLLYPYLFRYKFLSQRKTE